MAIDPSHERERLDQVAADSWYARGVNLAAARYCAAVFARHWRGTRCLELGPAEGVITERIAAVFARVVVVEGSERFARELHTRMPDIDVRCALFEDFTTDERFDVIVMGHVLEHVADPRQLIARAAEWLADEGIICAAVPNARSLHRQAAVFMGLLSSEHSLSEADVHHAHRRVYDLDSFQAEFDGAGLEIAFRGGYLLKPLSNAQMEADWSPEMVDAFLRVGERYPDIAGEIYVIARRKRSA